LRRILPKGVYNVAFNNQERSMSNLKDARDAIQLEIDHVKSGFAYYQARMAGLERALNQLKTLGEEHPTAAIKAAAPAIAQPAAAAAPAKKQKKGKTVRKARSTKSQGASKQVAALPSTGGDFWRSLITEQPQGASEILKAAIGRCGFELTKEQIRQLGGRQTFAINALVKTKKIKDLGTGRDRRFFK
jgi:hypothetical protein